MKRWWKIRREAKRFLRNLIASPRHFLNYVFGTFYYDCFLATQKTVLNGVQPSSDKRAVYLIFPIYGVEKSHLRTLSYLNARGFAVTVVSNRKLDIFQRQSVLEQCHIYIERPNFGYDFGGYRDGFLSLGEAASSCQQLVLLNDSVWFPVTDQSDWLEDVENLSVDLAGAVSNYGLPRIDPELFRDYAFDYSTEHRNFHYCSFALSFGPKILRDPDFKRFWKNFALSNDKKRTVRRGEIGLTKWAIAKGYKHGETLAVHKLADGLNALNDDDLREVVRHTIILEDPRLMEIKSSVLSSLDDMQKSDLVRFALMVAGRQGTAYASACYSILHQGFPFLKKSPMWLDGDSANSTLSLLERLHGEAAKEAFAEAKRRSILKTEPS